MPFQTYKDLEIYPLTQDRAIEIHKVNKAESLFIYRLNINYH